MLEHAKKLVTQVAETVDKLKDEVIELVDDAANVLQQAAIIPVRIDAAERAVFTKALDNEMEHLKNGGGLFLRPKDQIHLAKDILLRMMDFREVIGFQPTDNNKSCKFMRYDTSTGVVTLNVDKVYLTDEDFVSLPLPSTAPTISESIKDYLATAIAQRIIEKILSMMLLFAKPNTMNDIQPDYKVMNVLNAAEMISYHTARYGTAVAICSKKTADEYLKLVSDSFVTLGYHIDYVDTAPSSLPVHYANVCHDKEKNVLLKIVVVDSPMFNDGSKMLITRKGLEDHDAFMVFCPSVMVSTDKDEIKSYFYLYYDSGEKSFTNVSRAFTLINL